jgi:hypothetical protein
VAIDKSIWRYIARATYRRAPELERTACGRQPERQGVAMTACICQGAGVGSGCFLQEPDDDKRYDHDANNNQ